MLGYTSCLLLVIANLTSLMASPWQRGSGRNDVLFPVSPEMFSVLMSEPDLSNPDTLVPRWSPYLESIDDEEEGEGLVGKRGIYSRRRLDMFKRSSLNELIRRLMAIKGNYYSSGRASLMRFGPGRRK